MIYQHNFFTAQQNFFKIGQIVYCTVRNCFFKIKMVGHRTHFQATLA